MMAMYPINIKVKFGREVVTLSTADERVKTKSGVEIYMQLRQSDWLPWASIPDGTQEIHKHHKPIIQKCDWVKL